MISIWRETFFLPLFFCNLFVSSSICGNTRISQPPSGMLTIQKRGWDTCIYSIWCKTFFWLFEDHNLFCFYIYHFFKLWGWGDASFQEWSIYWSDCSSLVSKCKEDVLVIWETWKGWHTGNRYPNPTPIWDPNNMLNKSLTIQKLIQIQTQIQIHRKGGIVETDMTKCHSIRHQTPKFPTPPKKLCNDFFGVHRTSFWSN